MAKKVEDSLSYKIGYGLGTLFFKGIGSIFKLVWNGLVKASFKNIYIASIYVFLIACTVVSYLITGNYTMMIIVILMVALVIGIWGYIKEYPVKKRRKQFAILFEYINLKATDDSLPYYLYETEISEYTKVLSFATLIPLNVWFAKKDILEMELNTKILDIKQDKENNRIIDLFIEIRPLPDLINWNEEFLEEEKNILNIGFSHNEIIGIDLEKYPHSFIAGETGSGKSNILKCLIHQSLLKNYDVILIDFKRGVSFSAFSSAVEIYYDYKTVIKVLKDMVNETNKRLDKFREVKVDNINDYNRVTTDYLHRKIVFIDELAELLKTRDKETANSLNDSIETLTRISRAVGLHLIMGIQRPDSTIVNGQIKNNVSYRVCGRFVDKEPSRIMLGDDIASTLPNIKGRFIIKDDDYHEVQSFYFGESLEGNSMKYKKLEDNTNETNYNTKNEPFNVTHEKSIKEKRQEESQKSTDEFEFDFSDLKDKRPTKKQTIVNEVKPKQVVKNEVKQPTITEQKKEVPNYQKRDNANT